MHLVIQVAPVTSFPSFACSPPAPVEMVPCSDTLSSTRHSTALCVGHRVLPRHCCSPSTAPIGVYEIQGEQPPWEGDEIQDVGVCNKRSGIGAMTASV